MEKEDKIKKQLLEEIEELRIKLKEAEETLSAIRSGGVDAIVVSGLQGDQVFTLTGAERAYRVLIETMNEGAASLNQEGIIMYCNQRLSEMIKIPLEKVIGTPMRQFIRTSDLPVFDSLMEKGPQENGKGEIAFINNDGVLLPVLLSISALQKDNANICGITVTDLTAQKHTEDELKRHRDHLEELVKARTNELETSNRQLLKEISERKQSEDALRKSENDFHLLAESMPQIVWVTRPDGWNTYFNHQWMDYTGQTLEESYGHGWNKPFHPDDQQRAWEAWENATKHGAIYSLECRLRRADGVYKWWLIRGVPVRDDQGTVLKWFGTCTDIDDMKMVAEELKTSEERFRTAAKNLTDVLFDWDTKEKVHWYGDIDGITGYSPGRFPRTIEGWITIIHPEDKNRVLAALEDQLKGTAPYAVEYRVRGRDGEWLWWSARGTALRDDGGKPYKMVGSITDITERKLAEEEKLKLENQLRHAQKMEAVGTLAGGIAHDFNNILNVIMGYGHMVMDKLEADSPAKEHMSEVLIAAERAANLTKRLLVFSRKQIVEVKPVNINELIHGLQKMLVRIIRESIAFDLDLTERSLMVLADAGQIEQVLINLAANARDAMPEGGRLTIGTGLQTLNDEYVAAYGYGKPGIYALITVADTGQGMDAETQKKIFEPFFTTKGIGEGTGLGLAISYGIIKQHNGYIKAYSEIGKGTTFKIWLPVIEDMAEKKPEVVSLSYPKGGTETILVAEDDAALRKLSRLVLESAGYTVITAEDGEDAITKFMENSERIGLVLLDMIMPKKNGKEAGEVIRKKSPGIKILFASGYTMDIIKTRELTEASFDFILKPVVPRDLLRKVREILDG